MTCAKTYVIVMLASLGTLFVSGCRPSAANNALRKEKQQLQQQIEALETQPPATSLASRPLNLKKASPPSFRKINLTPSTPPTA